MKTLYGESQPFILNMEVAVVMKKNCIDIRFSLGIIFYTVSNFKEDSLNLLRIKDAGTKIYKRLVGIAREAVWCVCVHARVVCVCACTCTHL